MKRGFLFTTVALLVFTGIAFSHAYTLYYDHFVSLTLPAVSSGKTVASAQARVGIQAGQRFSPGHPFPRTPFVPYWACERTVPLEKTADRFVAKTKLSVTEMDAGPTMGPVMVEYRLTFTDGETLTMRAQPIKVADTHTTSSRDDYHALLAREQSRFNDAPAGAESSCVSVSLYVRGLEY
ncbi:MAG: hypothetical protein HY814_05220 [Candidatus Riflebacteria bacterium]|nr:hypothetical protein [Candidatus Riflebacteria bacterium]